MGLKQYDYHAIIAKLQTGIESEIYDSQQELDAVEIMIECLEDGWRMHWIDSHLQEHGYTMSTEAIMNKYNALTYKTTGKDEQNN